ncbi:MAG: hypothetical protein HGA71_10180 [Azonexaceae bacterium]|nr:hypothetical protein [Azonexaceae bacterium]
MASAVTNTLCINMGRVLLLLLLALLNGCASMQNTPADTIYQDRLGQVTVIAIEQAPELKFDGFVRSKGGGAALAGGGTFVSCMSGVGHCSGSMCGAALLLMLGVCGVAGLVGGVAGAVMAPSADQVTASEAAMARVFEVRTIQESVRHSVEEAALAAGITLRQLPEQETRAVAATKDYRLLAALGIDTVVETTLTKAGTAGSGLNDPAIAYMEVHVRLVDTASNTERYSTDYLYQGRRLDLASWSANQAKPLIDELNRGYRTLGIHICENIFSLYTFPNRDRRSAGGLLSSAFGLSPIYPPTRGALTGDRIIGAKFEWFAVEGLRPRFKWEAFPRPGDIAAAPDEMSRISNVRYDLLISREENMAPGALVYHREGLPQPEHTINISLQPDSRYFWTVRARFELDGRTRLTEWGATHFAVREKITAPSQHSYRFRTPGLD